VFQAVACGVTMSIAALLNAQQRCTSAVEHWLGFKDLSLAWGAHARSPRRCWPIQLSIHRYAVRNTVIHAYRKSRIE
jgi:hypothetical protein